MQSQGLWMSCSCDDALQDRPLSTESNLHTWAAAFSWDLDVKVSNVDLIRMRREAVPCKRRRAGVGWQGQWLVKISIMCCVRQCLNTALFSIPTLIFLYFSPPACKENLMWVEPLGFWACPRRNNLVSRWCFQLNLLSNSVDLCVFRQVCPLWPPWCPWLGC